MIKALEITTNTYLDDVIKMYKHFWRWDDDSQLSMGIGGPDPNPKSYIEESQKYFEYAKLMTHIANPYQQIMQHAVNIAMTTYTSPIVKLQAQHRLLNEVSCFDKVDQDIHLQSAVDDCGIDFIKDAFAAMNAIHPTKSELDNVFDDPSFETADADERSRRFYDVHLQLYDQAFLLMGLAAMA